MTQHHPSLEELSSYLDGQLSGAQRLPLERHLEQCPACQRELEGLQATVALLRRVPQAQPRRSFTLEPAYGRARHPWLRLRWATGLAALLLVAVVSLDMLSSLGAVSLAPSPPSAPLRVAEAVTPTAVAPTVAAQPEAGIAEAPADEAKAPPAPATPTPPPASLPSASEPPPFRTLEAALLALVALLGGLALAQERRRPRI